MAKKLKRKEKLKTVKSNFIPGKTNEKIISKAMIIKCKRLTHFFAKSPPFFWKATLKTYEALERIS